QLGDGAALAATTRINVVSDLRAMDLALGGQGAPIVPIGEKLLLSGYELFLNLGGIANISSHGGASAGPQPGGSPAGGANGPQTGGSPAGGTDGPRTGGSPAGGTDGPSAGGFVAYDVCPANRVLNQLAALTGKEYDEGGALASTGRVDETLLRRLNALPYYGQAYPKSLANEFGTDTVYPIITEAGLVVADALRTYVEHIAIQIREAVKGLAMGQPAAKAGMGAAAAGEPAAKAGTQSADQPANQPAAGKRMLVTGGGAHNHFLIGRLQDLLLPLGVAVVVPSSETDSALVDYKEALVMALIGVLRWREENNVLASVTGASRDSIGGAVWIGQEA
ncbi:MAG TPA: anhydro-N-acetylmuramic acid kinase, partial [Puia sp.]|nr:anhydro-N-acetylmuramic acid kinase [Puia sp.]